MRTIIQQSVILPAPAQSLYGMYLDPAIHAAITGAPVVIDTLAGSPFRAFEGNLSGTMLTIVEPVLIVQSWRSTHFNDEDPDSTLILTFTPLGEEGRIDLVHLDVPGQDYQGVVEGWEAYYWAPWRRYLARDQSITA
jgi:activator of HSP90 ATPase